jgi:hypothetical protein
MFSNAMKQEDVTHCVDSHSLSGILFLSDRTRDIQSDRNWVRRINDLDLSDLKNHPPF